MMKKEYQTEGHMILVPTKSLAQHNSQSKSLLFFRPHFHQMTKLEFEKGGEPFSAKGHLDIYNIIYGPYKIIK